MIVCPVCGFRNLDANDRCFKCSALLKRDESIYREAVKATARRGVGDRTIRLFTGPFDWLRHQVWFCRIIEIPDDGRFRYPFTAGLLSLIPGLGHVYDGQRTKGLLLFVVAAILTACAVMSVRESWSNVLLFAMLGYWLIVWGDSVAVAVRANGDTTWQLRKSLALISAAMMLLGVSLTVLQWLGVNLLTFQKVSASTMRPALQKGDRLLFSDVPLWVRRPRVGEVVQFDPPRFEATAGANIYSVNISKYFQRVVGGPGDHVVKRGKQFFRNDKLIPTEELPFQGTLLPDFDVTVPDGCFFIPVTGIPADVFAGLMGAGDLGYVGQAGYVFEKWPEWAIISRHDISALGLAVINPPQHRRWL